jgi:hypothetical protein
VIGIMRSLASEEGEEESDTRIRSVSTLEKTISVESIITASAHSVQAQDGVADNQTSSGSLGIAPQP